MPSGYSLYSFCRYTTFGSPMPSLKFSNTNYRYGFNGKENDPETGTQDYGMRIYDSRIAKFLSVDPKSRQFPFYTPYQFAGNKAIRYTDLDGQEEFDQMLEVIVNTGNSALDLYHAHQAEVDATLTMVGGLFTTIAGAVITPVCPVCGAIAMTYGVASIGYGGAQLANSQQDEKDQIKELNNSNNILQLTGNEFEKEGVPYAGDVGFYTGEAIDLAAGGMANIVKFNTAFKLLTNGENVLKNGFKVIFNGFKISDKASKGLMLAAQAGYDTFIADAQNKLSDITSIDQKIDFIENETGYKLKLEFEAKDKDGNMVKTTIEIVQAKDSEAPKKEIQLQKEEIND
jgi:RHS repeat-associated protein